MEVVQSLRRTEFPDDVKGALKHIERICISLKDGSVSIPGLAEVQQSDVPSDFIDEFIFHQLDWQGNRRQLTAIHELQLLDILCTFFQDCKNPSLFRQVFSRLFPLDLSPHNYRCVVLCKSVSLSIVANSSSFLACVAEWLNQDMLGNSPDGAHLPGLSQAVATALVQDYCLLHHETPKGLVNVASTSPEFACFFVRAIGQMFAMNGSPQFGFGSPPAPLLTVIADWLTENPTLLRTPVAVPPNTPPHRKQQLQTAPLFGLVRWCVKAPLIEIACSKLLKRVEATPKNASTVASAKTQVTLTPVYSRLNLAVLNSLTTELEDGSLSRPNTSPTEPFLISQMMLLAQELLTLHQQVRSDGAQTLLSDEGQREIENRALGVCLDRLAQTIQVAKATNFLLTQQGDLNRLQSCLPENALLRVVVSHWDGPQRS